MFAFKARGTRIDGARGVVQYRGLEAGVLPEKLSDAAGGSMIKDVMKVCQVTWNLEGVRNCGRGNVHISVKLIDSFGSPSLCDNSRWLGHRAWLEDVDLWALKQDVVGRGDLSGGHEVIVEIRYMKRTLDREWVANGWYYGTAFANRWSRALIS